MNGSPGVEGRVVEAGGGGSGDRAGTRLHSAEHHSRATGQGHVASAVPNSVDRGKPEGWGWESLRPPVPFPCLVL